MLDPAIIMQGHKIILFDAQCKLCSAWCNFIIANDPAAHFKLCSVQSPKGQTLLIHFGFSTTDFTTLVYIENTKAHTRSEAFFKIINQLGYPWKLFMVCRVLPTGLNNWLYNKVALNRYTLFGKYQYCRVPDKSDADHYL